jgi:hypothetical protein
MHDAWQRRAEAAFGLREWTPVEMLMEGWSLKNSVEGARLNEPGGCETRLR